MFQLIDFYAFTRTGAAIMAVCQCLVLGWIFGKKNMRVYNTFQIIIKLNWKSILLKIIFESTG